MVRDFWGYVWYNEPETMKQALARHSEKPWTLAALHKLGLDLQHDISNSTLYHRFKTDFAGI